MKNLREAIEDGRAVEGRHIIDRILSAISKREKPETMLLRLQQMHEDLGNIEYDQALEKWQEVEIWMRENEF